MTFYQQKEYEDSAKELLRAYELKQLPRVLLNLGTVYRKMGKAKEALAFYERYLKAEPNPPPKIKKDLDEFMEQTRALVDVPVVKEQIEKAKEPVPAGWDRDSGEMQPWWAAQVALEEKNKPIYKRPWFWGVIGGVAGAAIITGVAVGVAKSREIPSGLYVITF